MRCEPLLFPRLGSKFDADRQLWCKDHIPNFFALARCVFELSHLHTNKQASSRLFADLAQNMNISIVAAEDLIVAIKKKYNDKKDNCWKTCRYFQDIKHLDKIKKKHKLLNKTRKGGVLLSKFRTNMLPTNKLQHRFYIVSSN
ncbi:hypothetical protein AVEN_210373-1 [Araneus ventricosus]|uniref:Uncharacterized protein n=1 Tax=Araneus ventricosus TaxID=182803 RepID=A0A4Y2T3C4_ARAVE|nr:hypothetical protein AVEN_210373-1 [Araneus ventricosus]